jgi:hypothetical protein|tara:strand:- start:24 stop:209 length:186 start_codon:yes stop_codon:yes gene_type:complete
MDPKETGVYSWPDLKEAIGTWRLAALLETVLKLNWLVVIVVGLITLPAGAMKANYGWIVSA